MTLAGMIRRDLPIPFYYQLIQLLAKEIEGGSWSAGSLIPSEHDLCAAYGVSRTVVRQALAELANMGLLYRVKGKGTFVAQRKLQEKFIQRAEGFYDEMTSRGFDVRSSVREQRVVDPPVHVRESLLLPEGGRTIKLDRLRFVNDEPIQFVTTYLPLELCPDVVTADLSTGSLYALLRDRYGLSVASGLRTLEAVAAQRPIAVLLEVPKGAPLFRVESTSYLADGRPFEYYEGWHRGDRSKFEIQTVVSGEALTHADRVLGRTASFRRPASVS
jgi:GntR family transcriptional regulator